MKLTKTMQKSNKTNKKNFKKTKNEKKKTYISFFVYCKTRLFLDDGMIRSSIPCSSQDTKKHQPNKKKNKKKRLDKSKTIKNKVTNKDIISLQIGQRYKRIKT